MAFTSEPWDRADDTRHNAGTVVRCAAAIAIFVSGLVHLQLYLDGYRDFPNDNLGRSFLANAVASVVIAVLLVLRRDVLVRLAGAGLLAATLIAFWLSRTDNGIFGFAERGFQPSPQAALAFVVAIVGLVLLAVTFLPAIGPGDHLTVRLVAPVVAALLIVSIGGGALWARSPSPSQSQPAASAPATTTLAPATATTTTSPDTTVQPDTTQPDTTQPARTDPATTVTRESTPSPTTDRRTTTVAPATQPPVTQPPVTQPPVTQPPATQPPATQPPATQPPATQPPATEPPAAEPPPAGPGVVTISIVDFAFQPATMEIQVGTTVEWVNEDSFAHTVEADDGTFSSENLDTGDRFSFQFTAAGTFDYICGIHPSMRGAVVVTG